MKTPTPEKVHELLQTFHTAMLVTHATDDGLHARPMEIAQAAEDCHVWFFTDGTSPKSQEIRHDQEVLLTFQKDHQKYLCISGQAELVNDRTMIEAFWKEPYRVWFPNGVEDPNLTLVHVIPHRAEYWDNSGLQGVRYLYEAAKAYIQGNKPEIDSEEIHGTVTLAGSTAS